jgi:hypothetical protein
MQAGRVVEIGSHDDLSATTDGLYARLQAYSEKKGSGVSADATPTNTDSNGGKA